MYVGRKLFLLYLSIACTGLVFANDEQSDYFGAVEEYAHFLNVGEFGYLRTLNPVDGNNQIWGSDKDEDAASQTSLIRGSNGAYLHGFELVGNNSFYSYRAQYDMPENTLLEYQYLYWDFFPKASTRTDLQPAVISRQFFSLWVASTAAQKVGVELFFETGGKERLNRIDFGPSSTLSNLKFPVSRIDTPVSRVSINIIAPVEGDHTFEFALLAFSDSPTTIATLPRWPASTGTSQPTTEEPLDLPLTQTPTQGPTMVPTPKPTDLPIMAPTKSPTDDTSAECMAYYPDFINEVTPFAMYRITDQVPSESNHKLAVLEAGGTIISQTLNWLTSGQNLVGNFVVQTEFTLSPMEYIYIQNQYGSKRVLDEGQIPVDASSFGSHFCFWMRFPAESDITVTFVTNSTHQSFTDVRTPSSDWTNHCVDLSSLRKKTRKQPIDFSSLVQVLLTFTNRGSTTQTRVLEHTLMYFTDTPTIYTAMPAVFNPSFVLRPDDRGGCEYVNGPAERTDPPIRVPDKTPLSAYQRPYNENYAADNRLAVYLIKEDSHWLAFVHALKILGIPLIVTTNHADAIRHPTVLVYPEATSGLISVEAAGALARHSESHTVIFTRLSDAQLFEACENLL